MLEWKRNALTEEDGAGTEAQNEWREEEARENSAVASAEDVDERKTGDGVKSEAQKIADAMVAKKLKGMPSKEEVAAFRRWRQSQDAEGERLARAQQEAEQALAAAQAAQVRADAMIMFIKAGVRAEHAEDAAILAMAKAAAGAAMEDAMDAVIKNNPAWIAGAALPDTGGNPAAAEHEKKEPPGMI